MNLNVDSLYELDLKDDFIMNKELNFYQFIDGDLVKAFYLGINIDKWFKKLESEQQYLYSKQIRHALKDVSDKLRNQLDYWTHEFSDNDEVDLFEFSEYVLNNFIYNKETEEKDSVDLAFFLGQLISDGRKQEENH